MPIHQNVPNEPCEQRIREHPGASPPTGEHGPDPGDAGRRPSRPAPRTPGSRLGPAAGVETAGTEGQPVDAAPASPPPTPTPPHHGPSRGAERVLDDRDAAWFSPPTHGNRVAGTRTTGGFDNHPGRPDPDRLHLVDGAAPVETPGPAAARDDPRAGFPAQPRPDEEIGAAT